jgi:hypothetical protein
MIDNMPYVLAEASVMRIPLLIYDVGGVTEMIDPKQHADIICGTPKVRLPNQAPASVMGCIIVLSPLSWLAPTSSAARPRCCRLCSARCWTGRMLPLVAAKLQPCCQRTDSRQAWRRLVRQHACMHAALR